MVLWLACQILGSDRYEMLVLILQASTTELSGLGKIVRRFGYLTPPVLADEAWRGDKFISKKAGKLERSIWLHEPQFLILHK